MTNTALSPGVKLAWQLAGDLAVREKSAILPRHLLYGICSVEKLVNAEETEGRDDDDPALLAKPEVDRLNELSGRHGLDFSSLRRALRLSATIAETNAPLIARGQRVSRSPAAKQIFETAEQNSAQSGLSQVNLPCLFRAVLQARDSEIENAALHQKQALLDAMRELGASQPEQPQFSISLDASLRDLDAVASRDTGPLQIAETLDASVAFEAQHRSDAIERLAALSEITWEYGTRGLLDSMLQKAVDLLLRIVGKGERAVILVRDSKDGELLLKACGPPGAVPMISMTSAKRAIAERKGFIWKRGEDLTLSQKESNLESGMYVPLVVNGQSIGVICLDCFCPQQFFGRDDLLLVTLFAHQLALAIANHELQLTLKQNADVLERLLTNFSPKVRTHLLRRAQMGRLRLGGEKSVVSVLCADIRGFARLTADMPTDEVVSLLNEYFAALTDCIFRNDGTIDKFVGDAILAVFGSPEDDPQHCRKAVLAGMDMQAAAREVSQRRKAKGEVSCEIGIGIHTGEVLHGFIGSPERMEFTVIGDTVNRASRYCDGAKGSEVLISPEIHQHAWNEVEAQQISIPTKHEGDLVAYRVDRVRDRR
ncbi:MAG TPA: adenylate/guanylate cyclase domain-containing protein [Terriglobales bacterium]